MSAKPWFKFFVADFWNDAVGMTAAQRGAYISLLCYYWEHEGLPDNDEKLARIGGMQMRDWRRSRPSIAALFGPCWDHKRMNCLLQEWLENSNKRKDAAVQMHSKRRANVYAFDMLRARASESDKKNLKGESESNHHHHHLSDSEGTIGESQRAESQESPNVAESRAVFSDIARQEPPKEAFERTEGKRPDQLTKAEYEEMLSKRKNEAK